MAETRSLAVGISYLGYAEPGDGIAGTEFTQYPIIEQGTVVFNFNDPTTVNSVSYTHLTLPTIA